MAVAPKPVDERDALRGIRRIAHLVPSFGSGGAERVAADLATWAQSSASVTVVAPRGGDAEEAFARAGITVEGAKASNPNEPNARDMRRFALDSLIRLRRADLVHAHLPWPDRLGSVLVGRGRVPTAITFHLLPPEDTIRDLVLGRAAVVAGVARVAALVAPLALVALTEADRARLERALPDLRVVVIPNAPPEPKENLFDTRLPFGAGVRVLAVGRLHAQKGFERLIDAFARPLPAAHAFSVCIVGDGEERTALETRARASGIGERVHFMGALPASRLFTQADLFVTTSRSEGMPLALLEAMAAGIAVAASPIAAHREVLEGVEGALLSEDVEAWPRELARLMSDPLCRERIGQEARARVESRYTQRVQREAYARLYRELAARRG